MMELIIGIFKYHVVIIIIMNDKLMISGNSRWIQ